MVYYQELISLVKNQFRLDIESYHGIKHWDKVAKIGVYLAKYTKADPKVVYFFAYLHDSQRENESNDQEHGKRAAEYVLGLNRRGLLLIEDKQLRQLIYACAYHAECEAQSDDITIQTCWDADRLDLGRIGIVPNPFFLYTEAGKSEKTAEYVRLL